MKDNFYNILDYKEEKNNNNTVVIQSAIDHCHQNGGGTVYVPPGDYLIGSIF
jgi:polygalacturonase